MTRGTRVRKFNVTNVLFFGVNSIALVALHLFAANFLDLKEQGIKGNVILIFL
jgi:hypothetical protein